MYSREKQELLEKFAEVFKSNGIEKTSMRDLCNYAGKSTSVVYDMFQSKEQIVIECGIYIFTKIVSEMEEYIDQYSDNHILMLEFFFDVFKKHRSEVRFYIQILTSPNPAYAEVNEIYPDIRVWTDKVATVLGIDKDFFEKKLRIFVSIVFFYAISGDEKSAKIQRYALYDEIDKELKRK